MPRCVVVLTDGLRPDAIEPQLMPALYSLSRDYTSAAKATTIRPSVTVAALASLATGVSPATHGLVEPGLGFLRRLNHLRPLPAELAKHGLTTTVVAGLGQGVRHVARAVAGCAGVAGVVATAPGAGRVMAAAFSTMARQGDGLMFVYLADCDRAGHASGWMSTAYRQAAREVDAAVGALFERLDEEHLIVVADHGGGGVHPTDHDLPHPVNDHIPLVIAGPRARRRHVITHEVSLLDVPPTVLAALEVPVPREYEGRALREVFLPAPAWVA